MMKEYDLKVTDEDLTLLANVLNETISLLDEPEFNHRTGFSHEEARALQKKIKSFKEEIAHKSRDNSIG